MTKKPEPESHFHARGKTEHSEPRRPRKSEPRFDLITFDNIEIDIMANYLVKGIIPRGGLVVVWGPPKCGKSFWTFDLVMHVALGWEYRGHQVQQGTIIYLALEGAHGFRNRIVAWRQRHLNGHRKPVPFYLMSRSIDLVKEHRVLINDIKSQLGDVKPDAVVIDTLNRALIGDENSSDDMSKFIQAADAIRTTFGCAVIIIHHCGVAANRPRGHTSLSGADDAQIAIDRAQDGTITATVELMKDGPDGSIIASRLQWVELGTDDDGDPISSCVIEPVEGAAKPQRVKVKLADNHQLALDALDDAITDAGTRPPASNHIPQGGHIRCVPLDLWRKYFYARFSGEGDTPKKTFQRAWKRLQVLKIIGIRNNLVWRGGQGDTRGTGGGHVPQELGGGQTRLPP